LNPFKEWDKPSTGAGFVPSPALTMGYI